MRFWPTFKEKYIYYSASCSKADKPTKLTSLKVYAAWWNKYLIPLPCRVRYHTIPYHTAPHHTTPHHTTPHHTTQHNTVQCNTMQCSAIQCNTLFKKVQNKHKRLSKGEIVRLAPYKNEGDGKKTLFVFVLLTQSTINLQWLNSLELALQHHTIFVGNNVI